MSTRAQRMSIGTLATTARVSVETIRFYQRKHLLAKPVRTRGEIAYYTAQDVRRVKFVKAAQRLGFTLEEIRDLLALEDGRHCQDVRNMALTKLRDVQDRIALLRSVESTLEQLIAGCRDTENKGCCHLIASLQANL